MMQFLVIAAFVALYLHDALSEPLLGAWAARPVLAPAATLLALALCWILPSARIVAMVRRVDRSGSHRGIFLAERAASRGRLAATGVFAVAVLGLGWLGHVRALLGDWILLDELAALAPLVGVWLGLWWSVYPIERRLREAVIIRNLDQGRPLPRLVSRGRFVLTSARNQLLLALVPLLLIMGWVESLYWLEAAGPAWFARIPARGVVLNGLTIVGVAAMFTVAPAVMRHLWETERLEHGPLREHLLEMCARHGVRIREVLVWRTDGLSVNAAVMGIIGRLRYILMTDGLLEQLQRDEVEAVAAHEIAHVRRRHIPWLAAGVLGTVITLTTLGSWALERTLGPASLNAAPGIGVVGAGLVAAMAFLGFVSRRFEWQADAFAAQHLSGLQTARGGTSGGVTIRPEAVDAMSRALEQVAVLNGIPPGRGSWRHGSIALRRHRLAALVGCPAARLPIDRTVARVKLACLAAALAAVVVIGLDVSGAMGGVERPASVAAGSRQG